MKAVILVLALTIGLPLSAFAFGEVFKIETTGTEFCGDFDRQQFKASNNTDLWIQIVDETEILVSLTPTFLEGTTFPMFGQTYLTSGTKAAFVAGVILVDGSYATIRGNATFNRKTGAITSLSGTFIQFGVLDAGCFSSGTFKTGRRLS